VIGPGRWVAQGPLQVHPCKLGRRIHAAHAPAQPTCPTPDSFSARPPTDKEEEQQKRVARCACSCRAEPALGFADWPERSRAWAWLYKKRPAKPLLLLIFFFFSVGGSRHQKSVSGRVGRHCGVSAAWMPRPSPQGWVYGVPVMPTHPASPSNPAFAFPDQPTHPRGAAPLAGNPPFVRRKLKMRKHSAAIPQSSACNRSSLVFVTFQSAWSR